MTDAKFWDKVAESYAKSPIGDTDAYEYTLERTQSYLHAGDHLLELGCGTGTTALRLAPSVAQLTATDISPAMIAIAKRKALEDGAANLAFGAAVPGDPAITGVPFDAIAAFNLLHLVPDLEADIAWIHSALKPGGYFISKTFFVPKRGASMKIRVMKLILPLLQAIGKAPQVRFFDIAQLEGLITHAGFEIVESGNFPADRRFIVARKL